MKKNFPITQHEVMMEPGRSIVTKTDLKGAITYANEAFIRISGFSADELIGSSHNIVRHPDMPPEAFEDLWKTVKAGHPWNGLVKNRTKSGDYYWVHAFVTPLTESGQIVGYQSVRTEPTRDQVRDAERLYAEVRAGRAKLPMTQRRWISIVDLAVKSASVLAGAGLGYCASTIGNEAGPAMTAVGVGAAMGGLLAISDRLSRAKLNRLHKAMQRIDEGKLTARVEGGDGGLRRLFMTLESIRIHLRASFTDVGTATQVVSSHTQELLEAMDGLERRSSHQMENLRDVVTAVEHISTGIKDVSAHTERSVEAAHQTARNADEAMKTMHSGIEATGLLVEAVHDSQRKIGEVSDAVERIRLVSQEIRGIADQTNLLALNAAIEAARAGEQGRGFAVVADEVRKLAERTSGSTRDITDAVDEIISMVRLAVDTMNATATTVSHSLAEIDRSSASVQSILEASRSSVEHSEEVMAVLAKQAKSSELANRDIERIKSSMSESAKALNDVKAASNKLNTTFNELAEVVEHLR